MKQWTVAGRIQVRHGLQELRDNFGNTSPIAGARVRVNGRKRIAGVWGAWGRFGEDVTDAHGAFRVKALRDGARRQFKVEVKLKKSSFVVYGANENAVARVLGGLSVLGADAPLAALEAVLSHTGRATLKAAVHDVHKDADGVARHQGEHQLGTLRLNAGLAQAHGDVWVLFEHLSRWFKENGVPFSGSIGLKYPHNNRLIANRKESSYANPYNKVCYIISNGVRNQFRTRTILHELMHAWAFRNSTGETSMAWQLILNGSDRAGRIVRSHVAFHEAFAGWAARWVQRGILPNGAGNPQLSPTSRQGLINGDITRVEDVEHYLRGWSSLFNLLTTSNLDRFDFNRTNNSSAIVFLPERCHTPRIPFFKILRSFRANRRHRLDQISKGEMKLRPFMRRIRLTDGSISVAEANAYIELLDPNATAQPWELFCR